MQKSTLATVAATVANAPVVSPTLDILQHRSTIVFAVGAIILLGLPFWPGITAARLDMMTNMIIVVTGVLGGRFTLEGIMKARADVNQLKSDLQDAVPPAQTPNVNILNALSDLQKSALIPPKPAEEPGA